MIHCDKKARWFLCIGLSLFFFEGATQDLYDKVYSFGDLGAQWALVKVDRQYGFINDKGEEVVKPIYDKIYPFGEHKSGWAMVVLDGQIGFIDETGKIIPADQKP